jgi:Cu(I)/Ag(I) efflux system protein CusF
MNTIRFLIAVCVSFAFSFGVQAQNATPPAASAASAVSSPMSEGEVRKVDKEAGKLTLRHGPLLNLDMGAMTMVFRVADSKMFDQVKPGDQVRFVADRVNGQFTVVQIEAATK